MKPMLLTPATDLPQGKGWLYEPKYDGFRCILEWKKDSTPQLISRNGKSLNLQFPEVIKFCESLSENVTHQLPLTFDGELVHLKSNFRSDFNVVQTRGRMRRKTLIASHSKNFPCLLVVFDILHHKGKDLTALTLQKRKEKLETLFNELKLQKLVKYTHSDKLQLITSFTKNSEIWTHIKNQNGEGIIAKRKESKWVSGYRTIDWVKVKNWRFINVLLTKYDKNNGYFHGAVYQGLQIQEIVIFRHGLNEEEEKTLVSLFQTDGSKVSTNIWALPPLICITIACIDFDGKHLREPRFHSFKFEEDPENCTWQQMHRQLFPLPEKIELTHPSKPIWPLMNIEKDEYILYLQEISSFLLPFLEERLLTVIRYPHGLTSTERFYQKNRPDYAPSFVKSHQSDEIDYIICNDIETLLWLGNQLALEFHIPFQTVKTDAPTEIVFDLDPPSVQEFSLAIEAATRMKAIFDEFQLSSFVKTSGGKGLQLYIPLPLHRFTYQETRQFTEFVCLFLCEQEPNWFTTERLKKNRGNKLYLDYIQHDKGKTIIAPYSPRGNEKGCIATPLTWDEVTNSLRPDMFTVPSVLDRVKSIGDPFRSFRQAANEASFAKVLNQLNELDI